MKFGIVGAIDQAHAPLAEHALEAEMLERLA
jgi:hypothetical protein